MSSGYLSNGVDLDDIVELNKFSSPSPDFQNYFIDEASIAGRYQKPNFPIGFSFYVNGTEVQLGEGGTTPGTSQISELGTGTHKIKYSSGNIVLDDVVIKSGAKAVGITFCGGGGGGSSSTSTGDGVNGGGGAGGGIASAIINLKELTSCTVTIFIGGAGAAGGGTEAHGYEPGGAGGTSYIEVSGEYTYKLTAAGGAGGQKQGTVASGGSVSESGTCPYVKVTNKTTGGRGGKAYTKSYSSKQSDSDGQSVSHDNYIGSNKGKTFTGSGGSGRFYDADDVNSGGGGGSLSGSGGKGGKAGDGNGRIGYPGSGYGSGGGGAMWGGDGEHGGAGCAGHGYLYY